MKIERDLLLAYEPNHSFELICLKYLFAGNVMTLKFMSDSSVTAGGFQLEYIAMDSDLLNETII